MLDQKTCFAETLLRNRWHLNGILVTYCDQIQEKTFKVDLELTIDQVRAVLWEIDTLSGWGSMMFGTSIVWMDVR